MRRIRGARWAPSPTSVTSSKASTCIFLSHPNTWSWRRRTSLLLLLALLLVRRRKRRLPQTDDEAGLRIDVDSLPQLGPPAGHHQLEFYHVPVRVAAMVVAAAGRDHQLPGSDQLDACVDQLVPDLLSVVRDHQPEMRQWPGQVSSRGFVSKFFRHASLPGDHGKGTPWCSVAGKFEANGQPLLIGMILRADKPNSLGQVTVERTTQWLDILRVKPV